MDIGFIGLGNMGAHMARRLVQAGHKVFIYDTRQEAIGDIAALGGIALRSPKEVADSAETVMVSLPTPDIVLKVATGPDGDANPNQVERRDSSKFYVFEQRVRRFAHKVWHGIAYDALAATETVAIRLPCRLISSE